MRNSVSLDSRTIVPSGMYNSGCRFHSLDPSTSLTSLTLAVRGLFFAGERLEDEAILDQVEVAIVGGNM